MPDRKRGAAAERRNPCRTLLVRLSPASQILDRGSSATHSSHAATQRANISLIDRRSRWPRRVPYRATEHGNSLTAHCGQDQLVSVDKESHINVLLSGAQLLRVRSNCMLGCFLLSSEPHQRFHF